MSTLQQVILVIDRQFVSMAIYYLALVIGYAYGYVNVALNKPSRQAFPYIVSDPRFDSSNAVDGLKSDFNPWNGQCVLSANSKKTATWWVNLESIYSIHDIRIYYRTDNAKWNSKNGFTTRFLGFYVYVSNTTNRLDGHLCFHDTNYTRSTIPAIAEITCPVHGQYVIYYNERLASVKYPDDYSAYVFSELCEVEVYGCLAGSYGPNCSLSCPVNCRYCHIETGVCSWCKPGYQGFQCEFECDGGRYGQDCGQSCGTCLDYKQCYHINGSCLEGCDAGYEGTLCDIECPEGKFGKNCVQDCNENCGVPHKCNNRTGECEGGCQAGWLGIHCSDECSNNKYGVNCSQPCGNCRQPSSCHHINGSCLTGCDRGNQGTYCLQECSPYTYGFDCLQNCSDSCINNTCNSFSGACPLYGDLTQNENGNSENSHIAIIGGITGALIALLVILTVILVLRRRNVFRNIEDKQQTKRTAHDLKKHDEENDTDTGLSSSKKQKMKASRKSKTKNLC